MRLKLLTSICIFALLLNASDTVQAGEKSLLELKEVETVSLEEPWKFTLESPGWMAGVYGNVGVDGRVSHVRVGFDEILRHSDFLAALGGEARKGKFGVLGGFLYVSASDGIGSDGVIAKLDFRLDQWLADLALSWRVVDGPKGWIDVLVGTRYVSIYQRLSVHPNDGAIQRASERLVDALSDRIEERLMERLSSGRFREEVRSAVEEQIQSRLASLKGRNPPLPVGPLGGRIREDVTDQLESIVEARTREIAAAVRRRGALTAAELRTEVRRRVNEAREDLEDRIANTLDHKLDRTVSKYNDWFDPYIGLRGRYQISPAFYLTARGDIGGFGIGSDLTWQAYGAVGCQLSRSVFAEAGYRYLYMDYHKNGLINEVAMRGFQVTMGISF
ncbi:MAG: hypothetical protein EOP84_10095 [Verrucomicrobiaceae bacterium]|nr:MAG: hypothetical protein EOP84_10095 [Verrucomicrobiaceae bacterium]